jgi:cellulose synthase (UDP-forming)
MMAEQIARHRGESVRFRRNPHRISAYEAVGYTAALLLAAAIAFGWFDLMIPWGS